MRRALVLCLGLAACGDGIHITPPDGGGGDSPAAGDAGDAGNAADADANGGAIALTDDGGATVTSITFAATTVGQSRTFTVHVMNSGGAPTGPIAASISGTDAADF